MSSLARWQFTPSILFVKTPGDRTWWVRSSQGHKMHAIFGLMLAEIYSDGMLMGEEMHMTIGPVRIGIAMRFSHDALAQKEST